MNEQPLVERRDDTRQQGAITAVGEIGLDMANHTVGLVHGQPTQLVERAHLAGFNRDAGLGVRRAVVGLIAQQPRLGAITPQRTAGILSVAGVLGGHAAQLVGGASQHAHWWSRGGSHYRVSTHV